MKPNTIEDVLSIIQKLPNGCWELPNKPTVYGYIHININGQYWRSHRLTYTHFKGKIPTGLQIDHLCRNRKCCNPDHLEAVTGKENVRRSPIVASAINKLKTECPKGHKYIGDNLGTYRNNIARRCLTCHRIREKIRRETKKQLNKEK